MLLFDKAETNLLELEKMIQEIVDYNVPLFKSIILYPVIVLNIFITLPFTDTDANSIPSEFNHNL